MKKVLTVIISAVAFGLIAGVVMVGVNVFSTQTGIIKNNVITDIVNDSLNKNNLIATASNIKQSKNDYSGTTSKYNDMTDLIADVMPSVVSITNMQKYKQNGYSMFGFRVQPQEYEVPASGSGVIVGMTDDQIIILTNNHVIQDSSSLSVIFNDVEPVDAKIKGGDSGKDLAIISVLKKDIKPETLETIKIAKIGNSDNIKIGERVVAIGNALGIGQSVTSGIISAKDRQLEQIDNDSKLIQIDASINPGNSGGALINMNGELIGINVAKSSGTAIEGMGYAIPINVAGEVIETMSKRKDREEVKEEERGQLGIQAKNIDSQTAKSYGMPEGIYVYKINDDSEAKKSELREKDIIVSFDEQKIKTMSELQELLKYTKAGQEVDITVKRIEDGVYVDKTFKVKLSKKTVTDKKEENIQPEQSVNPNEQGQEYYDPFEDFEDIFRNFGFGW